MVRCHVKQEGGISRSTVTETSRVGGLVARRLPSATAKSYARELVPDQRIGVAPRRDRH